MHAFLPSGGNEFPNMCAFDTKLSKRFRRENGFLKKSTEKAYLKNSMGYPMGYFGYETP